MGSKSSNLPSWKGYRLLVQGNFHLVSHSALMPSWCGMRVSKASAPMSQLRFGGAAPSAVVVVTLCGDMACV